MHKYETFNISLDRKAKKANLNFISHAHTDHIEAAKNPKDMILSKETFDLIEKVNSVKFEGKSISHIKGIRLINAGHILGSRQLVIENEEIGEKIIYSGDFQIERSAAAEPIEIEEADTLIVDSTYPQWGLKFDEKNEVEDKIRKWVEKQLEKGIVLINAYAVGKAQEIIKILNKGGIIPVVSKKISDACKVYNNYGIKLRYFSAFSGNDEYESELKRNFVGVTEKTTKKLKPALQKVYEKKVFTAVATGFSKLYKFNTDAQFNLSDHADFYQKIEYIKRVNPHKIFTYGKDSEEFSYNLSKLGYNASVYKRKCVAAKLFVEVDVDKE